MAPFVSISTLTVMLAVICSVHSRAVQPNLDFLVPSKPSAGEYRFNYSVTESGDVKSQSEISDGTEITGTYRILQPDDCIRIVRYTAGVKGFQPTVSYEGDCQYKSEESKSTSVDDAVEENSAQASEVDDIVIPRELESMAMDILDALIPPVDDPVENVKISANYDHEDDVKEADPVGVVMDLVPVRLPSAHADNSIPQLDALPEGVSNIQSESSPETTTEAVSSDQSDSTVDVATREITDSETVSNEQKDSIPKLAARKITFPVSGGDSSYESNLRQDLAAREIQPVTDEVDEKEQISRCWGKPSATTTASAVIVEKIPESNDEEDVIITEPMSAFPLEPRKETAALIRQPTFRSPYLVYGARHSPTITPKGSIRTYLIRTPSPGRFFPFRKHPQLVPYKIKEVRHPYQRLPTGQFIRPISFPTSR